MTGKLLSLAEAFRTILRSQHPEREDLHRINSYRWFHDRQEMVGGPFGDAIRDEADKPAYEVLELLQSGVAGQKFRLRGSLSGAVPDDIDPIDASEGELDVFAGALVITINDIFRSKRTYTSVHCYADDLPLPKGKAVVAEDAFDDQSLRSASTKEIREEIFNVARDPANDRPNVKQLPKLVIPRLRELGLKASENRIIEIAGEDQFKKLRRQPGKTKTSERL